MAIRDKWTEEKLSVIYSLHGYCSHNVGKAVKEFGDIFQVPMGAGIFHLTIAPNTLRKIWEEEGWSVNDVPKDVRIKIPKEKRPRIPLSDEQFSVIYSLYEYCHHKVSDAKREFDIIYDKKVNRGLIKKLWDEEGWKSEVNNTFTSKNIEEKVISIIYSLYEYCNGDCGNAAAELRHLPEEYGDVSVHPVTITKFWRAEGWKYDTKYPPRNASIIKKEVAEKKSKKELTLPQREKLDRLFSDEKGDARAASRRMLTVSPEEAWEYWKGQKFVRGEYVPHHYIKKPKDGPKEEIVDVVKEEPLDELGALEDITGIQDF